MVKEKPAVSQVPSTVATMVDLGVLNMGDGKREKVCICFCHFSAQHSYTERDAYIAVPSIRLSVSHPLVLC